MTTAISGRAWTDADISVLKKLHTKLPARKIAEKLGRTPSATHQMAIKLGLRKLNRTQIDVDFLDRIRSLNGNGYSDMEIGALIACERHTVTKYRKQMGLPSNQHNDRHRAKTRAAMYAAVDRRGLLSPGYIRVEANRRHAEQNGWPSDLPPRAVAILNALEQHGPMTRREICDAIGATWRGAVRSLKSKGPGGTYLSNLTHRGLVVSLGKLVRLGGKGFNRQVYSLSMTAERRFDVAG